MIFFESWFRFGAVCLLLYLAILLARDAHKFLIGRLGIALSIASVIHLISDYSQYTNFNELINFPIDLIQDASLIIVWWFNLALFNDEFRLKRWHWVVLASWLLICAISKIGAYLGITNFETLQYLSQLISATLVIGHVSQKYFLEHKQDLVSLRRRIRILVSVIVSIYIMLKVIIEPDINFHEIENNILTPAFYFIMSSCALLWLTRIQTAALLFEKPQAKNEVAIIPQSFSEKDQKLRDRLIHEIENEQILTEHNLKISELAKKMSIPEYQLRALINKTMGFKNFNSFLNHYRIIAAKKALVDPELSNLPVLTIAMDVGYASLAPFNRAFKEIEGVTPTAYREQHT